MAVPQVTDFTLFSAVQLTGANWNTNLTQVVNYLTNGNYDFTINKITTTANAVIGTSLAMGGALTGVTTINASGAVTAASFVGILMSSNSYLGFNSITLPTASGTQAITGVGFKPSLVLFFYSSPTDALYTASGQGADKVSTKIVNYISFNLTTGALDANSNTTYSIYVLRGGNSYAGSVTSFDADGFTITWIKGGSPTGVCYYTFIAIK